ncbi:DUF6602 domain-containing protein [Fictibacillus sp. NPDC058756]|uniref:DUF6602 domain-containing protein n=1 Tax=Fictibacillus sp. NPDC058756 TaxID=3346625 RepID=UPI0036CA5715
MKEFLEILKLDASEIQTRFIRSSIEGKGTSQEVSDFREHAVQSFVERYYPFPYRISKGGIYDSYGKRSDSVDCLILNPNHPHTVDSRGKHSLIIADGVDVAIEVKPDISVKNELHRGLTQGISVAQLRRQNNAIIFKKNFPEYINEYAKQIPFFIFSMKCKKNVLDTIKEIKEFYTENNTPINEQVDVIIIFNLGLLVNYKYKEQFCWNQEYSDEVKAGWFFEEWKEDTLAGFLFHLNRVYSAEPRMTEPILTKYLTGNKYTILPV